MCFSRLRLRISRNASLSFLFFKGKNMDRQKIGFAVAALIVFGIGAYILATNAKTWQQTVQEDEDRPLSMEEMQRHLHEQMARSRTIYNMNPDNKHKLKADQSKIPIFRMGQ